MMKYFLSEEEIIIKYMKKRDCPCQIDTFDSGTTFIDSGANVPYDILFLDVSIENGWDQIGETNLREYDNNVYIICNGIVDYSPEGYKVSMRFAIF